MKIGITNDHRGVKRKKQIIKFLTKRGYEVIDYGANSTESVDYPTFAFDICNRIMNKEVDFGILLCGTGIGISIAANKVKGIRCAKLDSVTDAKFARLHNNANAIALNSDMRFYKTKDIIEAFLKYSFSNEERHIIRNNMIDNYKENKKCR